MAKSSYDLITIGDIKLDTFVVLDEANISCELRMPECKLCLDYGAKIDVDVVDSQIAGSAPNVAVGLARMKKRRRSFRSWGKTQHARSPSSISNVKAWTHHSSKSSKRKKHLLRRSQLQG